MKALLLSFFAVFLMVGLPLHDAEAKRFGGGKSSGMQRDYNAQRQATPQRDQAPQRDAAQSAPQNAGAATAAAGKRSWMGPLAGLAAGLGLAALAAHLGIGEEMASFLLILLLVLGGFFLFRMLMRGRASTARAQEAQMQYAGGAGRFDANPMHSANGPLAGNAAPRDMWAGATPGSLAASVGSADPAPTVASALPADLDVEAYQREAKLNFLRLQAAYDAGNLDDIREFTTPEMYAEIQLQLAERPAGEQQTEVLNFEAEVLDYAEEASRDVLSVRFHGLIREEKGAEAAPFDEVWHLTKARKGRQGWLVAGIQQIG